MSEMIRGSKKLKVFLRKKCRMTGLTEVEILELELFGDIKKKK